MVDAAQSASVFVVHDLSTPGLNVEVASHLLGGTVATPSFVTSDTTAGASITFHAAVAMRRHIWMSICFCRKHRVVAEIVVAAVTSAASNWTFMGQAAYMIAAGRRWDNIALVTEEEKAS